MGKRETTVENLTFINHTECHCVNRIERHRHPHAHHPLNLLHTQVLNESRGVSGGTTNHNRGMSSDHSSYPIEKCKCVTSFEVFYEADVNSGYSNGRNGQQQNGQVCRCDCQQGNTTCEWLKQGNDGFSIEDRR